MLARQSFNFQNISGGLKINFFCENQHEASFYIKKTNAEKQILNLSFKNYYFFTPEKALFWFLKKTPPQPLFSSCVDKNNICAFNVFKAKAEKKLIS